jgi:hypothetical protein
MAVILYGLLKRPNKLLADEQASKVWRTPAMKNSSCTCVYIYDTTFRVFALSMSLGARRTVAMINILDGHKFGCHDYKLRCFSFFTSPVKFGFFFQLVGLIRAKRQNPNQQ